MYAPFFGLSKEPFSIAPDPRFLYMSAQHREALAHLLYGLGGGGGFVLLTGEIGAGKTTVFRCFLEQLPPHCSVAYVFNPKLSPVELLQTVCGEFGIPLPDDAGSVKMLVDALNAYLLVAHSQGRQAVLVIDEAQSLNARALEQLRMLTNLETSERKLLQIVLIGQPELRGILARPDLEQLNQRVIARYHLGPLVFADTQQYIRHRLTVAGPSAPLPFSEAALKRIHQLSGGVPRRINVLADRALLGAYSQGNQRVEKATVDRAAQEVFGTEKPARPGLPWAVAAGMALLALITGGAWLWQRQERGPASAALQSTVVVGAPRAGSAPVVATQVLAKSTPQATPQATPQVTTQATTQTPTGAAVAALPPPDPAPSEPADVLAAAHLQQATAWRELALRWNVAIGEGDPCTAAAQAALACFRSSSGGLTVVRQLARPGVMTLRPPGGPPVHALLVGLDDRNATLQVGQRRYLLAVPALAGVWRGEFATFFRLPPGFRDGADAADPRSRAWVEQQLTAAGFSAGRPLQDRVWSFQLAQGLPLDGLAGPMTLMRLNRLAGVDEPRLNPAER